MEMPKECPHPTPMDAPEPVEPVTRKRALKAYSKGDLVRYVLELEARIERAQPEE